jgi:hypothetical protein
MDRTSDQQGPGQPGPEKISIYFSILASRRVSHGGSRTCLFCPAASFAVCGMQKRRARLPRENTAYIKEQLSAVSGKANPAFVEPLPGLPF